MTKSHRLRGLSYRELFLAEPARWRRFNDGEEDTSWFDCWRGRALFFLHLSLPCSFWCRDLKPSLALLVNSKNTNHILYMVGHAIVNRYLYKYLEYKEIVVPGVVAHTCYPSNREVGTGQVKSLRPASAMKCYKIHLGYKAPQSPYIFPSFRRERPSISQDLGV